MTSHASIFTPLFFFSIAVFCWSAWRRFSLLAVGKPEERMDQPVRRIGEMLRYAFGQKRVLAKPFGINHFVIFWSFIILMLANGEFILNGIFPSVKLMNMPQQIYIPLAFLIDIASLLALVAVTIAAIRRIVAPPYPEARTFEAFFILALIATLMLAYFGITSSELILSLEKNGGDFSSLLNNSPYIMPVSMAIASSIPPAMAGQLYEIAWWVHAFALMAFICFLPNSKHLHIMTAIPNCFLRRLDGFASIPREEFAVGNSFGVGRVDQFTWKDLLDSFSCTECGRCQNVCPANITGKPLNPRAVIHNIKVNLMKNGSLIKSGETPLQRLIGEEGEGSVPEEDIWGCTTCGACMEACPVFIEQMPKILEMRRYLVETESRFPEELLSLFENMEGRSNPWGIAPSERTKWCMQMDLKPFEQGKTEYLFYVGCAGSFDSRNKLVSVAVAQLLEKAGVTFGILGKDEKCCGDSLRRLGNEYVFDRIATENVALLKGKGVTKIITQCPHCFSTLKNDYRQYGLDVEVFHHSEILMDLLKNGKLKPDPTVVDFGKTLYHDSCYLGRHNDVYDAPRSIIETATGKAPSEMPSNRNNSFCCGAGGGRMWMEEDRGERINHHRVKEALTKRPDTVCVACPYCLTMFKDGLKDQGDENVRVRDIAELMAEAVLRKKEIL